MSSICDSVFDTQLFLAFSREVNVVRGDTYVLGVPPFSLVFRYW